MRIIHHYLILLIVALILSITFIISSQLWIHILAFIYWAFFLILTIVEMTHHFEVDILDQARRLVGFLKRPAIRHAIYRVFFTTIEIAFLVFFLIEGFLMKATWPFVIGVYFLLEIIVRGLLKRKRKRKLSIRLQYKSYIHVGYFLLILSSITEFIILQTINQHIPYLYTNILIYIALVYSIYRILKVLFVWLKNKNAKSYLLKARTNIDFTSGLFSIYVFQTAFLEHYNNDVAFTMRMHLITSFVVMVICIGTGLAMIVRGQRELELLSRNKNGIIRKKKRG